MSLGGTINVAKLGHNSEIFVKFGGQFCVHDFNPLVSRYK